MIKSLVLSCIMLALLSLCCAPNRERLAHVVVAMQSGKFHGWPANNGVWIWGNEILVGFTRTDYEETGSHNIKKDAPLLSLLARSEDGGCTWSMWDPEGYVGDGLAKKPLTEPIRFTQEGFALRVFGDTYHGTRDPEGGFFYSYDRGRTWQGPHPLGEIHRHPRFQGHVLTPRTDYLVLGENECLIFISSRLPDTGMSDDIAVIHTADGGRTFDLRCPFVVPESDPHRAVMPATVRISDTELVMSIRRRVIDNNRITWIDCYYSSDLGRTWEFRSKIGDAGAFNGNPPALARLHDGRLCAVFGDRDSSRILGRLSMDQGRTWGEVLSVRDDFYTGEVQDLKDLGYPRLVQNARGEMVAIYYWATRENPLQHIAATRWTP